MDFSVHPQSDNKWTAQAHQDFNVENFNIGVSNWLLNQLLSIFSGKLTNLISGEIPAM
jgi:hypothetical protein